MPACARIPVDRFPHPPSNGGANSLGRNASAPWSRRPTAPHCARTGPRAFTPDRWLEQDDEVTFGEVTLAVLHCPGHTPGHVVFFDQRSRLAIVGDVLFQGSIGRTDFPKGDYDTLITSIRTRLWPLGDDVVFIPGHGPISTIGVERRTNPFCGD